MFRKIIRNSPILYPLYVKYILRNRTAVFPCAATDLHLTGFPRSANTYCYNIVKVAFPALVLSTHIHTAASIKIALKNRVKTMVLVRDPVSTCCSLLLKYGKSPSEAEVRSLMRDYIEYHDYVLQNHMHLGILRFEDVVSSPEYIVRVVSEHLGFDLREKEIQRRAHAGQLRAEGKESNKAVAGSSLPNEMRKQMKAAIESDVRAHPLCSRAFELHVQLLSYSL